MKAKAGTAVEMITNDGFCREHDMQKLLTACEKTLSLWRNIHEIRTTTEMLEYYTMSDDCALCKVSEDRDCSYGWESLPELESTCPLYEIGFADITPTVLLLMPPKSMKYFSCKNYFLWFRAVKSGDLETARTQAECIVVRMNEAISVLKTKLHSGDVS